MASNSRCFLFLLLSLSFSLQTLARDTIFSSKITKETISLSPIQAPTLAPSPSPEPEIVEHGYGLYGQDPFGDPHTTTNNPTKTQLFDENFSKESGPQVYEKAYSNSYFNGNGNANGNGYVSEKQGMSDTRFLENGKYFYDVRNEGKEDSEEGNFDEFDVNENENENENGNGNGNGIGYENENGNGNGNGYKNENENEKYVYDVYNEKENNIYNSLNNFYDGGNENEYGNKRYNGNGNNEFGTQGIVGGNAYYNYPKKFPKYEFDSMEEYDREQGYGKDHYVP